MSLVLCLPAHFPCRQNTGRRGAEGRSKEDRLVGRRRSHCPNYSAPSCGGGRLSCPSRAILRAPPCQKATPKVSKGRAESPAAPTGPSPLASACTGAKRKSPPQEASLSGLQGPPSPCPYRKAFLFLCRFTCGFCTSRVSPLRLKSSSRSLAAFSKSSDLAAESI